MYGKRNKNAKHKHINAENSNHTCKLGHQGINFSHPHLQ